MMDEEYKKYNEIYKKFGTVIIYGGTWYIK